MRNGVGSGVVVRRVQGVVTRRTGHEVFVFDPATNQMHALNPAAAAVFEACDDTRAPDAIAALLADADVSAEAVRFGLVELADAGLITVDEPLDAPSRRELLKRIGAGAATVAAIPVIESIVAPTAAAAASATTPSPVPVTPTPDPSPIADINNEAQLRAAAAAGGTYTVNANFPIELSQGALAITAGPSLTLTSVGPGNATIDAQNASRVFTITNGSLTLTNMTITGGNASIGGGIYNGAGTVTLNGTTMITGNNATGDGGGIYNLGGTMTLNSGSIVGNTAGGLGGGIYDSGGQLAFNGGSVTNNTATNGGGLYTIGIISTITGDVAGVVTGNSPNNCNTGC